MGNKAIEKFLFEMREGIAAIEEMVEEPDLQNVAWQTTISEGEEVVTLRGIFPNGGVCTMTISLSHSYPGRVYE